jgi:hypothetical protein
MVCVGADADTSRDKRRADTSTSSMARVLVNTESACSSARQGDIHKANNTAIAVRHVLFTSSVLNNNH